MILKYNEKNTTKTLYISEKNIISIGFEKIEDIDNSFSTHKYNLHINYPEKTLSISINSINDQTELEIIQFIERINKENS